MQTPQDKIDAYQKQVRFTTSWFVLSLVVGVVAGMLVHYTGSGFPAKTAGILAAGIMFFPVYLVHINRKGYITTIDAWKLRTELNNKRAA